MESKIEVLNVIEEASVGGPQIRIVNVANIIKPSVETTVVFPSKESRPLSKRCEDCGINYRAMPISKITKSWIMASKYLLLSLFEVINISLFFFRSSAEIVHVSGGSWQFKGVIAGRLSGKKVLWHLNDTFMPVFIRTAFRCLNGLADGYIFASERSRNYYEDIIDHKKKQFVIPAPVDVSFFDSRLTVVGEEDLKTRFSGKFVVGTVGNVNPVKGIKTFIRSAAEINGAIDNVQFLIIGNISDKQRKYFLELRQLCSELELDNIEFLGGREDVRPLLNMLDVYVCSSHAESSPMAVWEAMSMAVPIVSTNVGDVPMYVKDGESGYITDVKDHLSISDRVQRLLNNPEECATLGAAAREVVVNHLDISRCAERHIAAYQAVLQ